MFSLSSLVQKAQAFIDPFPVSSVGDGDHSRAGLFRYQFRLPDTQSPLHDISAELIVPQLPSSPRATSSSEPSLGEGTRDQRYSGRLHLSQSYLCFSTETTSFLHPSNLTIGPSQALGTGPSGNGFTWPLCAIRRVERLPSQNYTYALAITPWNGVGGTKSTGEKADDAGWRLTILLSGSRQACQRFCDGLKKALRERVKDVEKMREVVTLCYSEYLMSAASGREASPEGTKRPEPPDAGLGMIFRYPGDARKLRDRSKMRLWSEYFRG